MLIVSVIVLIRSHISVLLLGLLLAAFICLCWLLLCGFCVFCSRLLGLRGLSLGRLLRLLRFSDGSLHCVAFVLHASLEKEVGCLLFVLVASEVSFRCTHAAETERLEALNSFTFFR